MPGTVFTTKDSVFFVGGRGTKAGDADVGGCTKAYWGDLKNPNKTLADVMGANGGPISASEAWNGAQNACHVHVSTDLVDKVRIESQAGDPFEDCEVGQVVNVMFYEVYPDGRYEVLSVGNGGDQNCEIDLDYIGDTACDAKVGGAFNYIQRASDVTDANLTNVDILTNKDRTFTMPPHAIDIDAGGGTAGFNTWKSIIGIDDLGIELTKGSWVTIDADGIDVPIFTINNVDNIRFKHIHAYNQGAAHVGFQISALPVSKFGFMFEECKASGGGIGIYVTTSKVQNISILGGYYEGSVMAINFSTYWGATIRGVEAYSSGDYVIHIGFYGATVDGCIIRSDGTGYGIKVYSFKAEVMNNVFYNVTEGIRMDSPAGGTLIAYNNIYVVTLAASGKFINRINRSIAYSDYSCGWALDGAPAAANRWGGIGIGEHSIEADPQFEDAANGDFRLKLSSPAYRTGRPTLGQL